MLVEDGGYIIHVTCPNRVTALPRENVALPQCVCCCVFRHVEHFATVLFLFDQTNDFTISFEMKRGIIVLCDPPHKG